MEKVTFHKYLIAPLLPSLQVSINGGIWLFFKKSDIKSGKQWHRWSYEEQVKISYLFFQVIFPSCSSLRTSRDWKECAFLFSTTESFYKGELSLITAAQRAQIIFLETQCILPYLLTIITSSTHLELYHLKSPHRLREPPNSSMA